MFHSLFSGIRRWSELQNKSWLVHNLQDVQIFHLYENGDKIREKNKVQSQSYFWFMEAVSENIQ